MATTTSREYFIEELRRRRAEYQTTVRDFTDEQARIASELQHATELLDHIEALLRDEQPDEFAEKASQRLIGGGEFADLSVNDALQKVMREVGRPLHADDLLEALQERGMALSQKDPKATVVTALVRGTQKGTYVRTGPNIYALSPNREMTTREYAKQMGVMP